MTAPRDHIYEDLPTKATPIRLRLDWARRFRGLIVRHAQDLADRSTRPDSILTDLTPLAAHGRWHERFADHALRPLAAKHTPAWLPQAKTVTRREPLGTVHLTGHAPMLGLGVDLLHAVCSGNRAVVHPSGPEADANTLLAELARAAWEDLTPNKDLGDTPIEIATGEPGANPNHTRAWPDRPPTTVAVVFAKPEAAARAAWSVLTDHHPGLHQQTLAVLVAEELGDDFARAIRPLAGGARPVPTRDPLAAFRAARAELGHGATSASGLLERPPGDHQMRPVILLDTPASSYADAIDPAEPLVGPVLRIIPVQNTDAAVDLLASGPAPEALAVFGPSALEDRLLTAWASGSGPRVSARGGWPYLLAHPDQPADLFGTTRSGTEGLLACTRPVTTTNTRPWPTPTRTTRQWFEQLYSTGAGPANLPEPSAKPTTPIPTEATPAEPKPTEPITTEPKPKAPKRRPSKVKSAR